MSPKVTVLLPVYNGEKYLSKAITSILKQTYTDFELLIINDGSTDNSVIIINSFNDNRIRLIENGSNIKLIATLNKGLRLSKGELIARMDCDDICLPERLHTQVEYFNNHPEVDIVATGAFITDMNMNLISEHEEVLSDIQIRWKLLYGSTIMHPSVMYRREKILAIGGYSNQYIHAEDYDLWSRISAKSKIVQIPQKLMYLRRHDNNIGVKYSEISSLNIVEISSQNIFKLSSRSLDYNSVTEFVRWNRGFKDLDYSLTSVSKTFYLIYLTFLKVYTIPAGDFKWITKNAVNTLSSSLFKTSIFFQLYFIIWSFKGITVNGHILTKFYLELIKKYFSSLFKK